MAERSAACRDGIWRQEMIRCFATTFRMAALLFLALVIPSVASAATPVTITVDLQKIGPVIPSNFTGLSFETKLTLADKDGHRYFRPDNKPLIAMFKQLNIHSLRIGGNSADNPAV